MSTTITLVTKRVTAAAHIRHTVTVSIRDPRNVATLNVPARRGPPGRNTAAEWKRNEW